MTTPRQILGRICGGSVLDVATGSGGFIVFLLDGLQDYIGIVGIDNNEKSAPAFVKNFDGKPNIRFVKMDAAKMDFLDAAFDTVCISNSLHHLSDLGTVLAEMKRVLRPGGRFIVSEMYRDNQTESQMTHVLMHHWWAAVDMAKGITHNKTYTRQELLDIVSSLGLQITNIEDLSDLSENPKDPETIKYLNDVVDQYLTRTEGLPDETGLRSQGLKLRQRLDEIGFHSATSLFVLAKKP